MTENTSFGVLRRKTMSWWDDDDDKSPDDTERDDGGEPDSEPESEEEEKDPDGEFDVYVCRDGDPASGIGVWIEYDAQNWILTGGVQGDHTNEDGHVSFPRYEGVSITIHINGLDIEEGPYYPDDGDSYTIDISE